MTRWLGILGIGLLAGCGADSLLDFVEDIGNGSTTDKDLVMQCTRDDFEILKPFVVSLADAALGDEAGPVNVSVTLPSGASMSIVFTGMNGSGLALNVPLLVGYTCVITTSGVPGAPQDGEVTVTLEAGDMLRVTGDLRIAEKCTMFVLDALDMRVDLDVLPLFRPTGSADVEAIADALLVVLSGEVTFDGAGRAAVDGTVTSSAGPSAVDFSVALN